MTQKPCGCPVIQNEEYEGRTFNWDGRSFYTDKVSHFLRVPLNVEKKMAEAAEIIERRGYVLEDPLVVLVREGSFSGALFIAVLPPEEESADVVTFGPSLLEASVYDRRDEKIGPGVRRFRRRLAREGKTVNSFYLWHLGCPQCTRLEGYKTVILAELA